MPAWNPRANEIFLQALEVDDPAARAALLERACAGDAGLRRQADRLRAAPAAGSFLEDPAPASAHPGGYEPTPPAVSSPAPALGSLFAGRYKLREKLGEGGM